MKSTPLALLVVVLASVPAFASSPILRGIKPIGGQRDTEVVVTLSGQRLADAQEILFYQPGITVTGLEADKDNQVKATFKIAADAPLGLHDFRLRTATGVSPLKTFSVGVLKEVEEVEPNNDFTEPQPIDLNVTVNGVADNEDIDYYAIDAKKGERITVEVEGIRLGLTLFDPYVAILDAKRFELASSDDASLIWQDGLVSILAPEDGTYIVAARESAYAGNRNCLYRLHVGTFPRPRATVPAGGPVGESVTVRWIGDVLGEMTTSPTLPDHIERDFGLVAQDDQGTAPYPNSFRLSEFGNVIESEPNDSHETATPFTPPLALNGVIEKADDVDQYVFSAKKDESYDVQVYARQIRSPLDSVMSVSTRNGGRIANNDDNRGNPDSYFRFKAPKDGEYVIAVRDHLKNGGPEYSYRVELTPVTPKLVISTPNESLRRGAGVQAVAVPKGNRVAMMINAGRVNFGGGLTLSADDLPAGVHIELDDVGPGTSAFPVMFSADADAPTAATLATLIGKPIDEKLQQIPCEFTSTAELVLGQNNVPFWTRTVESLAVAVTDEAPFTIEIIEPKVPIVRGGALDLKVVAHRKPGFTAPIAIAVLNNPPGISSKGGITIPEGKDEALIPVNANNGAELATWKIVVNGTYVEVPPEDPNNKNGNNRRGRNAGRLVVSSQLAKLTVAQPYLAMKFNTVSVEQGNEVDLAIKIDKKTDFAGDAQVTLIGLPAKAVTEPTTINQETSEIVFHLKTDPETPPGETKNLFCQVVITQDGEPIVHNIGSGRLRVDKPLPPKPDAPAATPKAATADASKPLSRLEQLRLENQERIKAKADAATESNGGGGGGGN
jgi:hypothetical protein